MVVTSYVLENKERVIHAGRMVYGAAETQGETLEELLRNCWVTAIMYFDTLNAHGDSYPPEYEKEHISDLSEANALMLEEDIRRKYEFYEETGQLNPDEG